MSFYKKYPWIFMSASVSAVILALYFITLGISMPFLVPSAKGSVVSASKNCSRIGGEMLEMGGSVADAAIAALLCEGVSIPALSGLGGGFIMILHISNENISVLNALGYAPDGVTKEMFYNEKNPMLGPKSILIPGELRGYGELHRKYGKLHWADLFQPSIDLCRDGVEITEFHHKILVKNEKTIRASKYLTSVFLDQPTNKILNIGQVFRQPIMAETLTTIANEGCDTLYDGTIAKKILQDVPDMLVTKEDLKNFTVKWQKPLKSVLQSGHMLFVPNIPTSGALLAYCFNILREWITSDVFSFTNWAYIIESFKLMFAVRGLLEDSDGGVISSYQISSLVNIKRTIHKIHPNTTSQDYKFYGAEYMMEIKDSQTTHICILSAIGNGISVTSTINTEYPWIFMSASVSAVILALYFITLGISMPFLVPSAKGSVVSASKNCSRIGGEMLEMGGSVADAAIAALLCEGVSIPALSGLGGGFIMILHISNENISVLNALGYAPDGVTKEMFYNEKNPMLGPKSILIPGELRGYGELHRKYGKLHWADLFQPSIDLCRDGVEITEFHHKILVKNEKTIRASKYLTSVFLDQPTNKILNIGQVFRQPIMAETLTTIANEGCDTLYDGTIAKKILQDVPDMLVTKEDLKNFTVKWQKPLKSVLQSGHMLFVPNIPTSGALLAYCFNILREWITSDVFSFTNWAYIIESFKLMFAVRGLLEDSDGGVISSYQISSLFNIKSTIHKIHPNTTSQDYKFYGAEYMMEIKDSETTHICILSALGNGISVTSTINTAFGSGVVSESTGIILNNEMDDFTTRPMPNMHGIYAFQNNTIAPKKQPMHSICPVMILNRDLTVRMVLGATGGARIVTSIAQVILKHLIFNMELKTSVNEYRLHHQLMPMVLYLDELYKNDPKIIQFFTNIDHKISYFQTEGLDIVTTIANTTELGIIGLTDIRRGEETGAYLIH